MRPSSHSPVRRQHCPSATSFNTHTLFLRSKLRLQFCEKHCILASQSCLQNYLPVLSRPFALGHPAILLLPVTPLGPNISFIYSNESLRCDCFSSVKWLTTLDRESYFPHRSQSPLTTASYPRVISIKHSSGSPYGHGIRTQVILPLLYSIHSMDSKSFSLRNYASAEFLLNPSRESPFSPLFSKEDSPSQPLTQLPSPVGSSSSTSSRRTQHQYCLTNGKGKDGDRPWLTLRVSSRSPKSKFLPLFIGKDSISGKVELELPKPETVREVKVTVRVVSHMYHNRLTAK